MVAQPRNLREQALVDSRLKRQYPQMDGRKWKKRVAKARKPKGEPKTAVDRIKAEMSGKEASLREALSEDEIKRLIGR